MTVKKTSQLFLGSDITEVLTMQTNVFTTVEMNKFKIMQC